MAGAPGADKGGAQEIHEPRECMACHGTGRVISNLGGSPSEVTCPWCQGAGVRVRGVDAQAHWGADRDREDSEQGHGAPQAGEPASDPAQDS